MTHVLELPPKMYYSLDVHTFKACMAGIVFAKFTKPTHRGETIMFSKNALISRRNGNLYLLVRLGDLRSSHLIGCHVSGYLLNRVKTEEGETVPYHLDNLHFGASLSGENDDLQLFWPLVVSHKIDSDSPLYDLSPKDLQTRQFEVIISLEGTTPETGNTIQVTLLYSEVNSIILFNEISCLFKGHASVTRSALLTFPLKYSGARGLSTRRWHTTRMSPSTPSPTRRSTRSCRTRLHG